MDITDPKAYRLDPSWTLLANAERMARIPLPSGAQGGSPFAWQLAAVLAQIEQAKAHVEQAAALARIASALEGLEAR